MKKNKYIIRKRAMGDVLWIEPVISALASRYDRLIVHTKFNSLFENYPYKNVSFRNKLSVAEKCIVRIERTIGTNFFAINLEGAYESMPTLHFLNAYQKKAGLPETREYPKLYLSESEKSKKLIEGNYVVVHAESFSEKKFRQVYGVDWEQIVTYFKRNGLRVVQLGIKDKPLLGAIRLQTSIRELISLISNASYFLGIDSGPSHIAASLGIPSLIVFGAIDPLLRHFPEKFNGILLKQSCDKDCTIFDVQNPEDHHCKSLDVNGIPRCCKFTTERIISELDLLIKQNDSKIS